METVIDKDGFVDVGKCRRIAGGGFQNRFNYARMVVRDLAKIYYEKLKNETLEWDEMKELLDYNLKELKHFVIPKTKGESREEGEFLHDERVEIYRELKNEFHKELKKFPRLTPLSEKNEEEKSVYSNKISRTAVIRILAKRNNVSQKEMYEYLKNNKLIEKVYQDFLKNF